MTFLVLEVSEKRRFLTRQHLLLFSEASPCQKNGVVEPLAYPSMKTAKGRFDSARFSQAFFPLFSIL